MNPAGIHVLPCENNHHHSSIIMAELAFPSLAKSVELPNGTTYSYVLANPTYFSSMVSRPAVTIGATKYPTSRTAAMA